MEKELRTLPCPFTMGLCRCQICSEGKILCISEKRMEEIIEFCGEDVFECVGFEPPKHPLKVKNANTN